MDRKHKNAWSIKVPSQVNVSPTHPNQPNIIGDTSSVLRFLLSKGSKPFKKLISGSKPFKKLRSGVKNRFLVFSELLIEDLRVYQQRIFL